MKRFLITSIFMLAFLGLFSQSKTYFGVVRSFTDRAPIPNAVVEVANNELTTTTNDSGEFKIEMPKKSRSFTVSHPDYEKLKYTPKPFTQLRSHRVYLKPKVWFKQIQDRRRVRDSIHLSRKNSLSLSLLELASCAIAGRFEHFISNKHSIGAHISVYVYGRNTVPMSYVQNYYLRFNGYKLAPAYRYYPGKKRRFFLEGKVPIGYYNLPNLEYSTDGGGYSKYFEYDFWTAGFGASVGIVVPTKRTKFGIFTFSIGYQYFPIKVPMEIEVQQSGNHTRIYKTNDYWWFFGGPGSVVDIKIMAGGLF